MDNNNNNNNNQKNPPPSDDANQKKMAAKGGKASKPGVMAVSQLDARIAEKTQQQSNLKAPPPSSVPGASTGGLQSLNELEGRIAAKVSAAGGPARTPVVAGASSSSDKEQLDALEDRIGAKIQSQQQQSEKKPPAVDNKQSVWTGGTSKAAGGKQQQDSGKNVNNDKGDPDKNNMDKDHEKGEKDEKETYNQRGGGLELPDDMEYGTYDVYDEVNNPDGLAVAELVADVDEETGDNPFIPAAVEYDPDAKPVAPDSSKKIRVYALLGIFSFVVIGVGTAVALMAKKTPEDPLILRRQAVRDWLVDEIGLVDVSELGDGDETEIVATDVNGTSSNTTELTTTLTAAQRALRWMVESDPQQLSPSHPNFAQRYILTHFYYATAGRGEWKRCNPPSDDDEEQDEDKRKLCILLAVEGNKESTYVYSPRVNRIRWLTNYTECEWVGVGCDEEGVVREIKMEGQNMEGSIPAVIFRLPMLESLELKHNDLIGPIPAGLSQLKHITFLDLQDNNLTSIPLDLWNTPTLFDVNLRFNKISGSLPSTVSHLKDVRFLDLNDNALTGTIPREYADLPSLRMIMLSKNQFNGTLPDNLGNSNSIDVVHLNDNDFSGTLPTGLAKSTSLSDFRVFNNKRLTGTVPYELFHPQIYRLDLFNCNFTGPILPRLAEMTRLKWLRLSDNRFTGRIPSGLGSLRVLQRVEFQGNLLSGDVPQELCALKDLGTMDQLDADCLSPPSGGEPRNPCSCCTECCADGENGAEPECVKVVTDNI